MTLLEPECVAFSVREALNGLVRSAGPGDALLDSL